MDDRLSVLSRSAEAPVDESLRSRGRGAAIVALRARFEALRPDLEVSPSGYVSSIEANLLPGVAPRHFVEDFENGDGRELESKFKAVHSSAAPVVNTFARFKDEPGGLPLAGLTDFETVAFEGRCAIGLRGGRPAHLDLLAQGPAGIVAVESRCTEHLERKAPSFSPAYAEQIRDERRGDVWFRMMELMVAEPEQFGFLDVAQLIKHAFGLARCFKGRPTTLLYLYWEPSDADRYPIFRQHRCEIELLSRLVAAGFPVFLAQSYRELWDEWQRAGRPTWLQEYVTNLRARYAVALGGGAQ